MFTEYLERKWNPVILVCCGQFHLVHYQCSSLSAADSQRVLFNKWPLEEAEHLLCNGLG